MADQQITDRPALITPPADNDILFTRDTSDLTDQPTGTDKQQTVENSRILAANQRIVFENHMELFNNGAGAMRLDFLAGGSQLIIRDDVGTQLFTLTRATGNVQMNQGNFTVSNGNIVVSSGGLSLLNGSMTVVGFVNVNTGDLSVNNGFLQSQTLQTIDNAGTNTIRGDVNMPSGNLDVQNGNIDCEQINTNGSGDNNFSGDIIIGVLRIDESLPRMLATGNYTINSENVLTLSADTRVNIEAASTSMEMTGAATTFLGVPVHLDNQDLRDISGIQSTISAVNPTIAEVTDGHSVVHRNTALNETRTWYNNAGTMISSPAFT